MWQAVQARQGETMQELIGWGVVLFVSLSIALGIGMVVQALVWL